MNEIIRKDKRYYLGILKSFRCLKFKITSKKEVYQNMATFFVCFYSFYQNCDDLNLSKKFYKEIELILQTLADYLNSNYIDNPELEDVYDLIFSMRKDYYNYLIRIKS